MDGGKFATRVAGAERLSLMELVKEVKNLKDVIYMNVGEPDFSTPPHIINAAIKALKKGYTHYTPDEGIEDLRRAIIEKERERINYELDIDNVLITSGATGALFSAIMSVINPGDEVIVQSPWYPGYQRCVKMAEGKLIGILQREEMDYQLDIDELNEKINQKTKAIIVVSPNNPTGGVLSRETLKAIADLAEDHDLKVIFDEVYEKFVYKGSFESIASIPNIMERTVIVNSFSKTYAMTGWRIGYTIGPKEWITQMCKVTTAMNLCASSIAQYAALKALTSSQRCVENMVKEYSKRRKVVAEELKKVRGLNFTIPKGSFYFFPKISAELGMTEMEFAKYLIEKARVVVSPGYPFFGPDGRNHFRIAYTIPISKIREAFKRIRSVLN